MRSLTLVLAAGFAGCSSQSSTIDAGITPQDDAPLVIDAPMIDAPPPTVMTVDCATVTPVATVTATTVVPYTYNIAPSATIAVGDVVQFVMPSIHNVTPFGVMTDSGMNVGFGQTRCLKFTIAGTFHFRCSAHNSLQGAITAN